MTAELLVNVTPSETRVAYIDGGILQEIHIEREARRGIVGNIYKGRVSRVLPGMQAAFVDIGLDKAAFLHASDIMPHTECVAGEEQKQFAVRDISELVRQGQDLAVRGTWADPGANPIILTIDGTLAVAASATSDLTVATFKIPQLGLSGANTKEVSLVLTQAGHSVSAGKVTVTA